MINKIKIHNIATFINETEINLSKINFFYGSNGTGKSTISKVLANPDSFTSCKIAWENNQRIKTIVFNEDFVRKTFYEKDKLNGIYTIGEGASDIENEINQKKQELEKIKQELNKLTENTDKKKQEKEDNFNDFKGKCWNDGYLKLQNDFDLFFTGYKKDKEKFANKILEEANKNNASLLSKEDLKNKYDLIYRKDIQKIDSISTLSIEEINKLEEQQEILKTSIIGKSDVDIAKMIEKLHNHDWVKQGKDYYEQNYDEELKAYICPFCQQKTSENFRKQLEEYFDETYQENINSLNSFIQLYKSTTEDILNKIKQILDISNQYLEEKKKTLTDKKDVLDGLINQNNQLLKQKQTNPSEKIELMQILSTLNEINKILEEVNNKINNHNKLIDNKKNEKEKFDREIWKYIVNELNSNIKDYQNKDADIEKALENLNNKIKENENTKSIINNEIGELEKQIKSVKPTVENINKLLESFGFSGFKLQATEDEKHYQIIRNDGSDAKKTLSEGERNFLVFLYFYHTIYGVENPEENINQDKILVIDDPVSSLDSEVLFIVSSLIKDILHKVRNNNDIVKQVFIFTHNAYFFKEITFISSRDSCYNRRNDTLYFILRKNNNVSLVEKYDTCPIKTSYQLLWDDIKNANIDCVSLQNSMRRIIEFYFNFLGNLNENNLINKFNGFEKTVCNSLIAWINEGSHSIIDDYNITISNEQIESYKNVFKKIFELTGHIEHYNMMMKDIKT